MEREFGALKGLMGANGLTSGDIIPEIGGAVSVVCSNVTLTGNTASCSIGCIGGCGDGCRIGCAIGCPSGRMNG